MRAALFAFLLILAALPGGPAAAGGDGSRAIATKLSFGALVARLDTAIEASGMYAVTRASASVGAKRRGIAIPGNMIVGVYRNDFAVRMLGASVESGIEAPIRFYITENADGTATLRYRTPSAVFAPYDGGARLKAMAAELDAIFARIAAQATAP